MSLIELIGLKLDESKYPGVDYEQLQYLHKHEIEYVFFSSYSRFCLEIFINLLIISVIKP